MPFSLSIAHYLLFVTKITPFVGIVSHVLRVRYAARFRVEARRFTRERTRSRRQKRETRVHTILSPVFQYFSSVRADRGEASAARRRRRRRQHRRYYYRDNEHVDRLVAACFVLSYHLQGNAFARGLARRLRSDRQPSNLFAKLKICVKRKCRFRIGSAPLW